MANSSGRAAESKCTPSAETASVGVPLDTFLPSTATKRAPAEMRQAAMSRWAVPEPSMATDSRAVSRTPMNTRPPNTAVAITDGISPALGSQVRSTGTLRPAELNPGPRDEMRRPGPTNQKAPEGSHPAGIAGLVWLCQVCPPSLLQERKPPFIASCPVAGDQAATVCGSPGAMPKNHTPPSNDDGAAEAVQDVAVAGARTVMCEQSGANPMPTGPAADAPPARARIEPLALTQVTAVVPTMPTGLGGQFQPTGWPEPRGSGPGAATCAS